MKTVEAVRYKQRLDQLFGRVSSVPDELDKAHWARYLCVLVSGFIDTAIRAIYSEYSRERAAPNVVRYACSRLEKVSNMNMTDICVLTGQFSESWRETIEQRVEVETKEAVDSIAANRNSIAHGRDVGISYVRVKRYYEGVLKMLELVEETVLGDS